MAHQSVPEGSRSALVRLKPDQRYRPSCHACGRPAQTVHSATRKFVRDLSLADFSLMLQIEYRKIWCGHCGGVRVEQLEFVDTQSTDNPTKTMADALRTYVVVPEKGTCGVV